MSAKYPRSFHLPWSPGGTSDDKRAADVSGLLGVPVVITEKLDGSNLTYTREHVFARSHAGPPSHPSFDLAKATWARIRHLVPEGVSLFCEYCYAVHSIAYGGLPDYSFVIDARDDRRGVFRDWDSVALMASEVGLPTVPVLFRGVVGTQDELSRVTEDLATRESCFGGTREGLVIRVFAEFEGSAFATRLAKWVRRAHVQTDEHWLGQPIRPQRLR